MIDRLKIFALVTTIAVVAWFFAESESLGEASVWATVRLVAPDEFREIEVLEGWDGRVFIELRGPTRSLEVLRDELKQTLVVESGKNDAVPLVSGEHSIQIRDLMSSFDAIREGGVVVESVSPISVTVRVTEYVDRTLPIVPLLRGVEADGQVTATPSSALVRLPRLFAETTEGLHLVAPVDQQQVSERSSGGRVEVEATLALDPDPSLENRPTIVPARSTVSFTLRSTTETRSVTVPVQVLMPSSEQDRWRVLIDQRDQVLTVSVAGPKDLVERIESRSQALVAVLALSSDELARSIDSKDVGFTLITGGVPSPIPSNISIDPAAANIRFTVEAAEPGSEPGE